MPDGNNERTQQIEKRIDPQVSGAIALSSSGGALTIAPQNMAEMFEFAKLMAISGPCVRPAFRGNPGACLALALQAFRTGADPFAVANKAYITTSRSGDEQIAYEAQYIHAVLNTSGKLARRLRPTYSGEGTKRKCKVIGYVVGEDDPLEYESPAIEEIAVKNSPLWKGDPDQQLFYYSSRAWGRKHLPEVLLGMYTPEDISGEVIDITPVVTEPRPRQEDYATAAASEPETQPTDPPTVFQVIDFVGETKECATAEEARAALLEMIAAARSQKVLQNLWENNESSGVIEEIGDAIEDGAEPIHQAYAEAQKAFTNPGGSRQDRPAAGAQQTDPARGATDTTDRGGRPAHAGGTTAPGGASASPLQTAASEQAGTANQHPEGGNPPQTEPSNTNERRSEPLQNTPNERPRDEPPASLVVPTRKPIGKAADWQGTAEDMVAVIDKLMDVDDVMANGRFVQVNRSELDNMRVANKAAWGAVMYRLGDRERQLRTGVP